MKNTTIVFCIILCHLRVFSQNIEVAGGIIADSIDVSSGLIRNVANPIAATDAATKAYVDLLETTVNLLETKLKALEGVKDIDNNRYEIVTIGTQTWMAENLKTTRYNDGTFILLITNGTAWETAGANTSPAYCWYNAPNETKNLIAYGALYNWYAIDTLSNGNKNLCPVGWHVPTTFEWNTLTIYLGGSEFAGGKMKEAGFAHWLSPNTGATNQSGFAGLPGGLRGSNSAFGFIGRQGFWLSSPENNTTNAGGRVLREDYGFVNFINSNRGDGFSVRCLRD
jgi:uncharacterized protein (TIGR02145 family)